MARCIRNGHRQYILDFSPLVELMLHPKKFKRKPQGREIGSIKTAMERIEVTLADLAEAVANGQTFCPGVLEGGCKNAHWKSQQVFALDFDNKENDPLALQHFRSKCDRLNIMPSLIYSTFSSTDDTPKFRALFLCQSPVTQKERSKAVMNALLNVFPEADQSCKDSGRLFFGGTKILYQDNSAVLFLDRLLTSFEESDNSTEKANTPAFQALHEVDFLSYIRSTGDYQETDCGNRIDFDPCPLCGHHGDFSYYKETNSYCCYSTSGGTRGSIVDFMMTKENISEHDAWLKLETLVGHKIKAAPIKGTSPCSILYGKSGIGEDKTELGLAKAFSAQYRSVLRYSEAWGWVAWDGVRWDTRSGELIAKQRYHELADNIMSEVSAAIGKNPGNKQLDLDLKWARAIRNRKTCMNILDLAEPFMAISVEKFDANPFDLNTPAGIVDLRTGEIRPHDPKAYCTNITKVSPDKDPAGKREWLSFLKWVTSGNQELMIYLQHIAGMASIGAVMYEGVVFS